MRFISASQGIGETGQLRGTLFEKHAHAVISRGGSFKIRDLQTGEVGTMELPSNLSLFLYSSDDEAFKGATNCYFRPVSKTFESIDSFIKPDILFQMTTANEPPCKQTGLRDILNVLGNPSNPRLHFVVPPDRFGTFKYQNYIGAAGQVLSENNICKNVKTLSQFVLTFEIASR